MKVSLTQQIDAVNIIIRDKREMQKVARKNEDTESVEMFTEEIGDLWAVVDTLTKFQAMVKFFKEAE